MPLEPVPTSPTRFPVKSTPSRGHVAVKYTSPSKRSRPGMSGAIGADRHPTAVTRKRAVTMSSWSVRISQRFAASSKVAAVTRVEQLDVASKIEAIGDVVEVPLDFGLLRVPTRPLPLLRQLRGERVAVVVALGVAPRAGIAVPVPRAADTVAGLEDADAQVQVVAELVERVETGEPRADHDRVEVVAIIHACNMLLQSEWTCNERRSAERFGGS